MSSLKDLASLIMIPSLYKDGELHTVKPLADEDVIVHPDATDNNDGFDGSTPSTSSNFTFSRGSNLAATRVDVNGLIEKGRENVGLYSADQTNWNIQVETSVSSNVAANPINGIVNADKVIPSVVSADHYRGRSMATMSGVITASIYIKADGYNIFDFGIYNVNAAVYPVRAVFDLSDESITFISGSIATINSVGGGWYRVSVTTSTSSGSMHLYHRVRSTGTSGSYSGDGTSGMLLFGAQLEQGLVATDYIETGTSAAQSGILEDMPRLDYSGGASCPALLLEPQRSNLMNHSEYFGYATWNTATTRGCNLTYTDELNPMGLAGSYKYESTDTNNQLANVNYSAVAGTAYTNSIYVKRVSGTGNVVLRDVNNGITTFSLSVADGWKRIDVTATASGTTGRLYLNLNDTGDEILVWGAQQEQGSYPTSYIPTYGTSQTRSVDVPSLTGLQNNDIFGSTQGTAILQFTFDVEGYVFDFNDTTPTRIRIYNAGSGNWYIRDLVGGKWYFPNFTYTDGVAVKIAIRWNGSEVVAFQDGVKSSSSSTFTEDITIDRLSTMKTNNTKQILAFPTALTDSECIALTSI